MRSEAECIFDGICHLGEGPIWNVQRQKLFWTDILNNRLWVYDPVAGESRKFWEGRHRVGAFAFTRNGGIVMCTDTGVYLLEKDDVGRIDSEPRKIVEAPMREDEVFNDITVDPKGRIFGGTMLLDYTDGTLYRMEKGKEPVPVVRGVRGTNGMTFSMDEKLFYYTDSMERTITRYEYDASTGEIANPRAFYRGDESQGEPDGITLDTEDHVWVAFWGASVVRRLAPTGEVVEEVPVPAIQPSSVIFGGEDLRDLYITTACEGAADIEKGLDENGNFLGGPVYRYRTQVTGRPEWLADFD